MNIIFSDEWIHRFGEIQKKIKEKSSDENIEELKGLERDFSNVSNMYGQVIIFEKYLPSFKKTVKVKIKIIF